MRPAFRHLLADYGMVGVLLALCLLFSLLTIQQQPATGSAGGESLADHLLLRHREGRFLVLASRGREDQAFVQAFETRVIAGGGKVVGRGVGTPREVRSALTAATEMTPAPDAIAVSAAAAEWDLLAGIPDEFPAIKDVPIVRAESHTWPAFLQLGNLLNIANHIVVVAVIAIGMTMVIVTGGIDLSVGSVIALSSVVTGVLIEQAFGGVAASPLQVVAAAAAGLTVAALVGLANGMLVATTGVAPFIVTLSTMLIVSGSAFRMTQGEEAHNLPPMIVTLGRGDWQGIPYSVLLMGALYLAAHVLMSRTVLGRHIYAVGGNPMAARLSGIVNGRILVFVYVACSFLAGLGGVIMASELKSGSPRYGQMYELYVIAAVVVGGTSLAGGKGTMFGTLVGALIIAVIRNGMNLLHIKSYTQNIVFGLVILGAAILDQWKNRRLGGRSG